MERRGCAGASASGPPGAGGGPPEGGQLLPGERRTRLALALLVAATLGGAARGVAAAVAMALGDDRWRRALVGADGLSDNDARLAPVRARVPVDAVVEVRGDLDLVTPGGRVRVALLRYALAPRRVRVGAAAAEAPFVLAVGEAAAVSSDLTSVLEVDPDLRLLRRVQ